MDGEIKQSMPHSPEAEMAVIGSMLMDAEAVSTALEILHKDDFYNVKYAALFEAMSQLNAEGKACDLILVQDKLRQNQVPEEVSSIEFIRGIIDLMPTSALVAEYAKTVKNQSDLRKLLKAARNIEKMCTDASRETESVLSESEKMINDITQSAGNADFTPIGDITLEAISRIEAAAKAGGKITGIPTGFTDLDYRLAGLQNSDLILIAARPAMGKTAFVLNIAQYASIKHDYTTVIFNLEMSAVQQVNRILALESKVNASNIRTGNLSPADWRNLSEGAARVGSSHLIIEDNPDVTVEKLRNKCRKLKREQNLGLIIIDYIQLMSSGKKNESRQNEVAEISRSLKKLARELNVPVIALSQLSRKVEERDNKRPMLSDLRESGAIEQDADVVMFLYRDDYYNKDKSDEKDIAEVIIAKQRAGSIGTVKLAWIPELTKFANLQHGHKNNDRTEE